MAPCMFQSRSKHEDPEQLKLKEKAKAVSRFINLFLVLLLLPQSPKTIGDA